MLAQTTDLYTQVLQSAGIAPSPQYREQLQREATLELARSGLLDFTKHTFPKYKADPFHEMLAAKLDEVVDGKLTRLMVFAPPQHGKSELVSVRLPAFWLGRRPDDHVILCSYGASLAQSKSRAARTVVESGEYQELFPEVTTNLARRAVDEWEIMPPHRGRMVAAGVGGPITGHGAELGIIDDPFENWKEAQSETIRENIWEWWKGTFRTRIREGAAIVLIMTRWHEDDLAGRLLKDHKDAWEVLRFPAMAESQKERDIVNRGFGLEEGLPDPLGRKEHQPLCPQRYSRKELESIRIDVGSMVWSAEYQGAPILPEGNRFKRDWFDIVDISPSAGFRVRYWDKAATAGGGDYTVGLLMSHTPDGYFYVEDVVRGQWSSGERDVVILQTAEDDKRRYGEVSIWVEQEPGAAGKESAAEIIRKLAGHAAYADTPTGSKDVRLEPYAAQAEARNVKLVRADWNRDYLDEICAIPNAKYRDQGDASSGAFNRLAEGTAQLAIISYRTPATAGQMYGGKGQRSRRNRRQRVSGDSFAFG